MNLILGMFMESWIQSKWSPKGFMLTLQETRSIHDSMNRTKIDYIANIYVLYKYLKYRNYL